MKAVREHVVTASDFQLSHRDSSPSLNMIQLKNDQDRFTAERVVRTRPKAYRAIVRLLADPDARIEHIAQRHRVSTHTVRATREREAVAIAERKQRLMLIFANVAEISAERMEELAGDANLRDAGTTAGIATDKLLALSGDLPSPKLSKTSTSTCKATTLQANLTSSWPDSKARSTRNVISILSTMAPSSARLLHPSLTPKMSQEMEISRDMFLLPR